MSVVKQIFINYTNNQQAYYPGQTLSGVLCLEIVQPLAPKAVNVVLRGRAHVYWTETTGTGDDRRTHSYSDNENYFDHPITVWPSALHGSSTVLPPGTHSFPFAFTLPLGIPSSFEGSSYETTYIRYWIMAVVELQTSQIKCKRPFTVIEYIDVNDNRLLVPMRSENEKMICCWCCESGPLTLQATIDRVGFCPGEAVVISASAENLTNRVMRGIRVQLIAVTRRTAHGYRNHVSRVVCVLMGEPIAVRATDRWENRLFPIPPVPPSIKTCRIIDQSYYIQLSVIVPNGINLIIHFPIVMGTIPLRREAQQPNQQVTYIDNRTVGRFQLPELSTAPQNLASSTVPAYPPPYAEATGITADIREHDDRNTMGVLQYTPLLPFMSPATSFPVEQLHGDPSPQPFYHGPEMPGQVRQEYSGTQHHPDISPAAPSVALHTEPFGDSHAIGCDALPMQVIESHCPEDLHEHEDK